MVWPRTGEAGSRRSAATSGDGVRKVAAASGGGDPVAHGGFGAIETFGQAAGQTGANGCLLQVGLGDVGEEVVGKFGATTLGGAGGSDSVLHRRTLVGVS